MKKGVVLLLVQLFFLVNLDMFTKHGLLENHPFTAHFPSCRLPFLLGFRHFPMFFPIFSYDLWFSPCFLADFPCNGAPSGNTRPPRRPCTPAGRLWWRKSGPWRETRRSLAPLVGNSGKQWPWIWFFPLFLLGKSWGKKDGNIWESHKLNEGFIDGRISKAKWRILWACSVGGHTWRVPPLWNWLVSIVTVYYCITISLNYLYGISHESYNNHVSKPVAKRDDLPSTCYRQGSKLLNPGAVLVQFWYQRAIRLVNFDHMDLSLIGVCAQAGPRNKVRIDSGVQ